MSAFTDLDRVREDLDSILTDVLSAVLSEEAVATEEHLGPAPLAVARLAIHDQLEDDYAVVELRTGVSLARVIAARMMMVALPVEEDIVDSVAEISNIAAGNVKTLLCRHARLSLPSSEITDLVLHPDDGAPPGAYVRAHVLGHVAQLAIQPRAPIDGLTWPPYTEEILEKSP